MRKKASTISVGMIKRHISLFLIICCTSLYPKFGLLAEPNLTSTSTTLLSAVSSALPSALSSDRSSNSPSRTKIFFYNPEINTARNLVLKTTWDRYLHEMGSYDFQPVDNVEDFTKLIQKEKNAVFIMAEWLYASIFSSSNPSSFSAADKENVEIAFRGMKDGKGTYQKILVANKASLEFEKVTIASSGTKARAHEVLKTIYPELSTRQLESLKVLIVPKDIDALMAVGYGLAEMALTTQVGLSKMAMLNEHIYKDMIVVKESKPLRRSVLVFKSSNKELKASLAQALIGMSKHSSGQEAMTLLGLDEWRSVAGLTTLNSENLIDNTDKEGGQNNDK